MVVGGVAIDRPGQATPHLMELDRCATGLGDMCMSRVVVLAFVQKVGNARGRDMTCYRWLGFFTSRTSLLASAVSLCVAERRVVCGVVYAGAGSCVVGTHVHTQCILLPPVQSLGCECESTANSRRFARYRLCIDMYATTFDICKAMIVYIAQCIGFGCILVRISPPTVQSSTCHQCPPAAEVRKGRKERGTLVSRE